MTHRAAVPPQSSTSTTRPTDEARARPLWAYFAALATSVVLAAAAALAAAHASELVESVVVLAGLVGVLLTIFLTYRRIALSIARLAAVERERTRVRLLESAAIVESSNDAIIGKSLEGMITSWNAAAERMYGYSELEAVGHSIELLVPKGQPNEVPALLARVRAGERVQRYETSRVRKDGETIAVSLTVSPVKNADGEIVGASTIARDIMDLLRAEQALRSSEESYRLLFERHPAPMWVFDPETLRFLEVNQAAIDSYGYSREEFMAMTVDEIGPEAERDEFRALLADLDRDPVDRSVGQHRKRDGALIDVAVTSNAIEFEGRPARLVLAQDVTEQGRLEEQLRQSQKMEAIGSLAGGIAHDFNNLLLVIRGYGAVLMKQVTDEKQREAVAHIEAAANRAGQFTQQLLAFSRQQVLRPQSTDMNEVVEEMLAMLRRTIGADIEVDAQLDPNIPPILIDRGQLAQAVLNLAINARDAMGETGGTLTIRTAAVELDNGYASTHEGVVAGSYALLQLTDSGTGMDADTQSRAFDPFFTTKGEGTGLGLATVHGLVKQSGGHIWLYSEPGMGTTFKLYFPITAAPAAVPSAPGRPLSLEGHETILLVEDTEVVRTLVAGTLRSYGYTVRDAASGAEAIALAEELGQSIDLLMTDVVMPGMNGRELADTLTAKDPGLRVLFTSGYPSDAVVRHGIESARAEFIEKPYLPEDLACKVREILDRGAVT